MPVVETLVDRPLRLLVVEDEMFIRMFVCDVLREAGYDVVEAVNGDEALELLKAGVSIDLVLSDVRMPGSTDGMALLDFVKKNHAGVPVIISSGHLDPGVALGAGAAQFLGKPFRIEEALAVVELETKKMQ